MPRACSLDRVSTNATVAGPAPRVRRVLVFVIVALPLFMMTVDSTIVATALHTLQHDLDTSVNWVGWTITAYSLGFIVMLPVTGRLSTRYGRRRIFLLSVATFTAASLACGLVDDIYLLVVLRVLQAAGGAGFTPSATGIIVDHFGDARDRAVSLFGSIFPIGALVGPIFGGLFVTYWSWRGIFLVNVPLGLAAYLLAVRFVPRDPPRGSAEQTRLDIVGMLLLGVGVLAGMLAVSYLGEPGARVLSPLFVVPIAVAGVGLVAFFRHLGRTDHPFIAPQLIHGPGFGAVNLFTMLFSGMSLGAVSLVPLYATNRYGIDALDSGLLLVAQGVAAVLVSTSVTFVLRRTGYRMPLWVGSGFIIAGILVLAAPAPAAVSPFVWLGGGAFLIGVGTGAVSPPSRNAGLQLAPQASATIAALRSMSMQIGTIVAISAATTILASSGDSSAAHAWVYLTNAAVLVLALPLIPRIPEHRGAW